MTRNQLVDRVLHRAAVDRLQQGPVEAVDINRRYVELYAAIVFKWNPLKKSHRCGLMRKPSFKRWLAFNFGRVDKSQVLSRSILCWRQRVKLPS